MPRPKPEPVAQIKKDWRSKAECHTVTREFEPDPTVRGDIGDPVQAGAWITEDGPLLDSAKSICKTRCKVRLQCLSDALDDPEAQGMRGGYYFDEGGLEARDRRALMLELGWDSQKRQRRRPSEMAS